MHRFFRPTVAAPPEHLARRLQAIRFRIQQKSLDGYLVARRSDQCYLTGFNGDDSLALVLPEAVYLLTDARFEEEAVDVAPWAVVCSRRGSFADVLAGLTRKHRIRSLGFDPESLPVAAYHSFRQALRRIRLVAAADIVSPSRIVKDNVELVAIRRSIAIAEDAFRATVRQIRIGMTELQLAAVLQHEMLDRGAAGSSFPIIVAEGANASRPHAVPGQRRLARGSAVLIDWGAVYQGYCSDLTRVVFIRRIPARIRRMYAQVLAAQEAALEVIRPGLPIRAAYQAARDRFQAEGVAAYFTHSLGHGLGLDIHEPPRLADRITEPLRVGMVVTVEPGLYYPGLGGVRIEDDILVTATGCEVLTHLPRDLESMVV